MPTSKASGKGFIKSVLVSVLDREKEIRFIDFGVGRGTYSNLLRNEFPESKWIGVEAYEPYIERFGLKEKYDEIIIDDMLDIDVGPPSFDIAFLGDVLEHCTKSESIAFLGKLGCSIPLIVVSLPLGYRPQGMVHGNPYETHKKDNWIHAEALLAFDSCVLSYVEEESGIYFLSSGCPCLQDLTRSAIEVHQALAGVGILELTTKNLPNRLFRFIVGKLLYISYRVARYGRKEWRKVFGGK